MRVTDIEVKGIDDDAEVGHIDLVEDIQCLAEIVDRAPRVAVVFEPNRDAVLRGDTSVGAERLGRARLDRCCIERRLLLIAWPDDDIGSAQRGCPLAKLTATLDQNRIFRTLMQRAIIQCVDAEDADA